VADLPGRPDVVFTRTHVAVFVDGCFWHMCPEHGTVPRNNRDWWLDKLLGNVERDRRVDGVLAERGWVVVRLWEHDHPDTAADVVEQLHRSRMTTRGSGVRVPRGEL
jgi:DNA mismatch endonuclease, patch repair protein